VVILRLGLDYRPALLGSSGIARSVRELVRALARRADADVHLFGHSWARARRCDPLPAATTLHRLPIPGRSLPWLTRIGIGSTALCGGVPLFHWTDYVYPPVRRARVVVTVHDVAFAENPRFHGDQSAELHRRARAATARATLVITPSHSTAAAAEEHLDVDARRLRIVPFGTDHVPTATPQQPGDHAPFIVALGTIEPRKNHLRLLRAWRMLPQPRPQLIVIGRRGWDCTEVIAELTAGQQRGELVWYEDLDDDSVFHYLGNAQALVYPSLLEGFGFPPLEALALGTAVVASDTPALRETLGDAAAYCDPYDERDIARAIQQVLANPQDREALRDRGAKRVAALTWDACAAGHMAAYREAMT